MNPNQTNFTTDSLITSGLIGCRYNPIYMTTLVSSTKHEPFILGLQVYSNIQDIDLCTVNGKCRDKHRELWFFPNYGTSRINGEHMSLEAKQCNFFISGTPLCKTSFFRGKKDEFTLEL
ncbi:hypothetical protein MTR67_000427 [Solanum verrucosum]|uniref:Uncharacterized protein n=1 Tax=Solanum verrucosum TaxID=315347 RepID=A0AAF0T466_SOLVR|nr:hypothetical protein MTR67_000427 [Solanum verrucosum]